MSVPIIFSGEIQLAGWSDSHAQGPTLKIRLPDQDGLEPFRGATTAKGKTAGQLYYCVITEIPQATAEDKEITTAKEGNYKTQAEILFRSSFFRNPEVWRAVGSDNQLIEWTRTQRCIHCAHQRIKKDAQSEAAHVRRIADGAGTGIKPQYAVIPLCRECHGLQHQKGESAIGGKDRLDEYRVKNLHAWCWDRIKKIMDVGSMRDCNPMDLLDWAKGKGVDRFIPSGYLTEG